MEAAAAYPVWSIIVMVINGMAIYGLTVYGEPFD
jgi:multidrug transporter EmrE-like cation transporter